MEEGRGRPPPPRAALAASAATGDSDRGVRTLPMPIPIPAVWRCFLALLPPLLLKLLLLLIRRAFDMLGLTRPGHLTTATLLCRPVLYLCGCILNILPTVTIDGRGLCAGDACCHSSTVWSFRQIDPNMRFRLLFMQVDS